MELQALTEKLINRLRRSVSGWKRALYYGTFPNVSLHKYHFTSDWQPT